MALTLALLTVGSVRGQSDHKPYSREAAERSFRALVAAEDSDILGVMKDDGLVCFADSLPFDSQDRFLTIVLPKPSTWIQDKESNVNHSDEGGSIYDGKTDLPAISYTSLSFLEWENQNWTFVIAPLLVGKWHSVGHYQLQKNGTPFVWKNYGDLPPVFRFAEEKDEISGATNLSAMEDDTTFYASKKYERPFPIRQFTPT